MRYRAVIFDLFGTLVDNDSFVDSSSEEFGTIVTNMARVISASPEAFARLWHESTPLRTIGTLPSVEAAIEQIAAELGLLATPEAIREAAELRIDYNRRKLVARPDAVTTLTLLHEAGYKMALVSNCSPDVPLLWNATPLAPLVDVPVFSSAVGLAKPNPAIFRLVCERLGVPSERCVYVADGEGGELAAATAAGMRGILIRCSYDDPPGWRRPHVEEWSGASICWLSDVPALLLSS